MNKGCFKKNHIPHNKGKNLSDYLTQDKIDKINETTFKVGQTAGDRNSSWKGGIQVPKNDCVHIYGGVNKRIRRPRHIWETHHNTILPEGYIIYHIDGNKHNDNIENLEAISRAELLKRNSL